MSFGTFFDVTEFDQKMKRCSKCRIEKLAHHFYKGSTPGSLMSKCKDCRKPQTKQVTKLKTKHLPPEDPDYQCPICDSKSTEIGRNGSWVMDHDHTTGEYRAYICHGCNVGLGYFKDDPVILQKAIDYLNAKELIKDYKDDN